MTINMIMNWLMIAALPLAVLSAIFNVGGADYFTAAVDLALGVVLGAIGVTNLQMQRQS